MGAASKLEKQTQRATDLKALAEMVALVATNAIRGNYNYRPTITTDPELADAFDWAMFLISNPTRAYRGIAARAVQP